MRMSMMMMVTNSGIDVKERIEKCNFFLYVYNETGI